MAVKASAQITMTDVTDIDSTCRYYLLQSSTLSKPSKPTTNPPSSSWTKTEPSYTAGSTNSLYFTDLTVYSNGEFSYSDVSLSSSYEAAKAAYNKAVEAAKTATNYINYSSSGGLQVGNKTSGSWSGFRTQITSEAFNILNAAGETLASYGAKLVELGKNAADAVITFCNEVAKIYVDGGGRAVLEAWSLLISATNTNSTGQLDLQNSDGTSKATLKTVAYKTASTFYTALIEVLSKNDGTSEVGVTANKIKLTGKIEGSNSIKVGNGTAATGANSAAFGDWSQATGEGSFAANVYNSANGKYSFANGANNEASGEGAHAEGTNCKASGDYAHAEGRYTLASGDYQHVEGSYNIEDASGTYAHIVGNGSSSKRSNAHTLDWNGNAWFAGDVEADGDVTNGNGVSLDGLDNKFVYSAEEHVVGKWINGKSLYRKTISCGALPNNGTTRVYHGIDAIETLVDISGTATDGTTVLPLPCVATAALANNINVYVHKAVGGQINIQTGINRSSYTESYITLLYTKVQD